MLNDLILTAQALVGPAERIKGAQNYLGRGLTPSDVLTLVAAGFIAAGFILLIIGTYIQQKKKHK